MREYSMAGLGLFLLLGMACAGCERANSPQGISPPVSTAASSTDDLPPLDFNDLSKIQQQLDAMSADQVAKYLADPKSPEFSWAYQALRNKGEAAIPHLAKLMGREDLGFGWSNPPSALLDIGDASLPTLIDLLQSENPVARRHAAWALMKRKKPAKDAIKPLIEVVRSKDKEAAGYAAAALTPNSKNAIDAVPYLIPLTFEIGSRTHAPMIAIKAIGLDAKLIPDVVKYVAQDDDDLESKALRIELGAMLLAAADKGGAEALTEALGHKNLAVRLAAMKGIQGIGHEVRTSGLEKALNNALAEDALRADAATALVAIGASAKAAVPGLMKDLESGELVPLRSMDYKYRSRAAEVLAKIPEAGPALVQGLNSDKKIVRIGCRWTLSRRANLKEARLHLCPPTPASQTKD